MSKEIQVVPYDHNWPYIFEKEAELIRQYLDGDKSLEGKNDSENNNIKAVH